MSFLRWFAPEGVDAFFFLEVRVGGEGSSEVFLDLGGHRRLVFFCSLQHTRVRVFWKSIALLRKSTRTTEPHRLQCGKGAARGLICTQGRAHKEREREKEKTSTNQIEGRKRKWCRKHLNQGNFLGAIFLTRKRLYILSI